MHMPAMIRWSWLSFVVCVEKEPGRDILDSKSMDFIINYSYMKLYVVYTK